MSQQDLRADHAHLHCTQVAGECNPPKYPLRRAQGNSLLNRFLKLEIRQMVIMRTVCDISWDDTVSGVAPQTGDRARRLLAGCAGIALSPKPSGGKLQGM